MLFAAALSEDYADILDAVSTMLLPFWLNADRPLLLLSAWFAAFSSALSYCQKAQGADLPDERKNWLLLHFLGEHGRRQLDLHLDTGLCMDTTPHENKS